MARREAMTGPVWEAFVYHMTAGWAGCDWLWTA